MWIYSVEQLSHMLNSRCFASLGNACLNMDAFAINFSYFCFSFFTRTALAQYSITMELPSVRTRSSCGFFLILGRSYMVIHHGNVHEQIKTKFKECLAVESVFGVQLLQQYHADKQHLAM